jgi:hypothetical protein
MGNAPGKNRMSMLDDLNHFRGAILTKTIIDRQQKITTAHDGTAQIYGPPWPAVSFSLNHINHAHYKNGQGPHLFQITFTMVHRMTGAVELVSESMEIASITIQVPEKPIAAEPPTATIALGSGHQLTFAFASVEITSRKR